MWQCISNCECQVSAVLHFHFASHSIAYVCVCVCVSVALVIQHAKLVRHIVICGLPRSPDIFSTLSHKRHDFRKKKKKLTNTKCVFWFPLRLLSETFLIMGINKRDMIKIHIGLYVKYPLLLPHSNEPLIFSTIFRKIPKYQISWKSVHCHADGHTWRSQQSLFAISRKSLKIYINQLSRRLNKCLSGKY